MNTRSKRKIPDSIISQSKKPVKKRKAAVAESIFLILILKFDEKLKISLNNIIIKMLCSTPL